MPFLAINGWTVSVANATPRQRTAKKGRRGRSFRGAQRDSRRFIRRQWDIESVHQEPADGTALERLLYGEGHFIDFADGLQASTGLVPLSGAASTLRLFPTAWGAFGRGVVAVPAATSGVVLSYDAQLARGWTVLVRRMVGAANAQATWVGHALRSDGVEYVDGAASSSFGFATGAGGNGLFARVIDGVLELVKDATAHNEALDDLVILPYRASNSMLAAWTAPVASAVKFGPCPVLRITGDLLGEQQPAIFAVGEVTGSDLLQTASRIDGYGWVNSARVVRFTLSEVDPAFVRGAAAPDSETPTPPGAPIAWFDGGSVDGRFDTTIEEGDRVSTWVDRGSRAQNASSAGADRPTFTRVATRRRVGDAPAVRFGGTHWIDTDDHPPNISSPVTIAAVWRTTTIGATGYVVDRGGLAAFRARLFHALAAVTIGAEVTTAAHATAAVAGNWNTTVATLAASGSTLDLNGDDDAAVGNLSDTTGSGGFIIGARTTGANGLDGEIAELLVWAGVVDHAAIDAYLQARYGEVFPQ